MTDWWQEQAQAGAGPNQDRPLPDPGRGVRPTGAAGGAVKPAGSGGMVGALGANTIVVGATTGIVASVFGLSVASVINGRLLSDHGEIHLGVRTIAVAFLVGAMLAGWAPFTAGQTRLGVRRGLVAGVGTAGVSGLLLPLADRLWDASRADGQPGSLLVLIGAWVVIGGLAGGVAGIEDGPARARNGLIGGLSGGLIGGLCFAALSADFRMTQESSFVSQLVGYTATTLGLGLGVGLTERLARSAWLVALDGPQAGREFILYREHSVIGTADDCEVYLRSDDAAAARHAEVNLREGRLTVNPVDGPIDVDRQPFAGGRVATGSVIRVGGSYLRVELR